MSFNCLACGSDSVEGAVRSREMMFGLRETFTYQRCASCSSLTLADPPDDLARYYPAGYYSMRRTPPPETGGRRRAHVRVALSLPLFAVDRASRVGGLRSTPTFTRWLAGLRLRRTDRIGDIGSGSGALLHEMLANGFTDLWGFDPFLEADADDGIHLRRVTVEGIPHGFRLLMANHSLEHVPDPLHVLQLAGRALLEGGHILVRIPIAGSYADRTFGPDWVQLDPPRHLWVPSERGMRLLAGRAGLEVRRVFYDSSALQFFGSAQYRQDVPLRDPRSVAEGSNVFFSAAEIEAFARRARELNILHQGDQAGSILKGKPAL